MSGDLIRHVSVNQFLSFYFDGNPLKTEFLPKKTVGPTFSQITHKMRELQRPNVESFFDLTLVTKVVTGGLEGACLILFVFFSNRDLFCAA